MVLCAHGSIGLMVSLPEKLKKDAIAEALCEIRFECKELPELVVGRLAANEDWKTFTKQRLAVSDIPAPIRAQDPTLKYQPTLQLTHPQKSRIVKFGNNVLSYHVLSPYCGWLLFYEELKKLLDFVFNCFDGFSYIRIGFRYINLLTEQDHYVSRIEELNHAIQIAGEPLVAPLSLNYIRRHGENHIALVRIASPEFVSGPLSSPVTAVIDVDIFTPDSFRNDDRRFAVSWLDDAHEFEKQEFFKLIPSKIIERLREE